MSKLNCKVIDVVDHDYTPEKGVTRSVRRELFINGAYVSGLPNSCGKEEVINCCTAGMDVSPDEISVVFDKTPRVENEYLNRINL